MQWSRSVFRVEGERDALRNSFRHLPLRPTESSISRVAFAHSRWESQALGPCTARSCELRSKCTAPCACGEYLPYHSRNIYRESARYLIASSFTCCPFLPSEICPMRSDLPHSGGAGQSCWKGEDGSSICSKQRLPMSERESEQQQGSFKYRIPHDKV